jgi:hypothetical protein
MQDLDQMGPVRSPSRNRAYRGDRWQGVLTEAEFEQEKARILSA